MVSKWKQELAKYGETISYYAHSLGSRNSTTNRKVSQWAAATNITAMVRTQPSSVEEKNEGAHTNDTLFILTDTAITKYSVFSWNSKYYQIVMVEETYWNKALEYYKGTAIRMLEFLGASG